MTVSTGIQNVLWWRECKHGDVCATDRRHRR